MVRRQRAKLRGECRCTHVGELVGVNLDRQTVRARHFKYARTFSDAEGDLFAEHIHGNRQALGNGPWNQLLAD